MNLLIVDDEPIAVKGMIKGIDPAACGLTHIWTAYSGENALQILNAQQVDLMLCDIEMPGLNGIELLRAVRRVNKNIVCIFLTCQAKFEYAQEAVTLGCREYLLKPVPYDVLTEKIHDAVKELETQNHRQELERYRAEAPEAEAPRENRSQEEIVAEVEAYILANISDCSLLVSDIAEKMFLNKDYLNRVFKKQKGLSISQFLIRERMKLAGLLLSDSQNSVNYAAEQTGYDNYPYFASSFKRYYGCSPTQYQKEHKK